MEFDRQRVFEKGERIRKLIADANSD